jgi:hypothetical protein
MFGKVLFSNVLPEILCILRDSIYPAPKNPVAEFIDPNWGIKSTAVEFMTPGLTRQATFFLLS